MQFFEERISRDIPAADIHSASQLIDTNLESLKKFLQERLRELVDQKMENLRLDIQEYRQGIMQEQQLEQQAEAEHKSHESSKSGALIEEEEKKGDDEHPIQIQDEILSQAGQDSGNALTKYNFIIHATLDSLVVGHLDTVLSLRSIPLTPSLCLYRQQSHFNDKSYSLEKVESTVQ